MKPYLKIMITMAVMLVSLKGFSEERKFYINYNQEEVKTSYDKLKEIYLSSPLIVDSFKDLSQYLPNHTKPSTQRYPGTCYIQEDYRSSCDNKEFLNVYEIPIDLEVTSRSRLRDDSTYDLFWSVRTIPIADYRPSIKPYQDSVRVSPHLGKYSFAINQEGNSNTIISITEPYVFRVVQKWSCWSGEKKYRKEVCIFQIDSK